MQQAELPWPGPEPVPSAVEARSLNHDRQGNPIALLTQPVLIPLNMWRVTGEVQWDCVFSLAYAWSKHISLWANEHLGGSVGSAISLL